MRYALHGAWHGRHCMVPGAVCTAGCMVWLPGLAAGHAGGTSASSFVWGARHVGRAACWESCLLGELP
eukprot:274052-Chlamydomonas_euryale.AAC.1